MVSLEFLNDDKIREFILEDIGFGDITTNSIVDENIQVSASVLCNENAVVAGLNEAFKVFTVLGCEVKLLIKDGSRVTSETCIMQIKGPGRAILIGERTALNLLMRMSGIATVTQRIISKAKKANPYVKISCTRKTVPGLRFFDKKAVELGGGDTHRLRLDDCVLIKDNHLKFTSSVKEAVFRVKNRTSFTKKIEIEVENFEQALEAAEVGVDIIMLDNMKPIEILDILEELEIRNLRKNVLIEASGGITEKNIEDYAKTGVDIISMGILTHSVRAININLEIIN